VKRRREDERARSGTETKSFPHKYVRFYKKGDTRAILCTHTRTRICRQPSAERLWLRDRGSEVHPLDNWKDFTICSFHWLCRLYIQLNNKSNSHSRWEKVRFGCQLCFWLVISLRP
jgi:hypothetical protein